MRTGALPPDEARWLAGEHADEDAAQAAADDEERRLRREMRADARGIVHTRLFRSLEQGMRPTLQRAKEQMGGGMRFGEAAASTMAAYSLLMDIQALASEEDDDE